MTEEWIEDPVLGLRMCLRPDKDSLHGEVVFEPNGRIGKHFHPHQSECWMVDEGELAVRIGRRRVTLGPGAEATVPPGARHSLRNRTSRPVHARFTATPALDLAAFLTQATAMNRAGRVTSFGLPKSPTALLEGAEFIDRYRESCVLLFPPPFPPAALQPFLFGPLAGLARRRAARDGADRSQARAAR
jgi:mannose-6-phosphate isomerase-like protein (cupin superfamily)